MHCVSYIPTKIEQPATMEPICNLMNDTPMYMYII